MQGFEKDGTFTTVFTFRTWGGGGVGPECMCRIQTVIAPQHICSVLIPILLMTDITKLIFMSRGWSFDMFFSFPREGVLPPLWIGILPFGEPLFYWSHLGSLILICRGSSYLHAIM